MSGNNIMFFTKNDWRKTIDESCVRSFVSSGWQLTAVCSLLTTNDEQRKTKDERRILCEILRKLRMTAYSSEPPAETNNDRWKTNDEQRKTTDEKRSTNPVWDPSQAQDDSTQQWASFRNEQRQTKNEKRPTTNEQRTTTNEISPFQITFLSKSELNKHFIVYWLWQLLKLNISVSILVIWKR